MWLVRYGNIIARLGHWSALVLKPSHIQSKSQQKNRPSKCKITSPHVLTTLQYRHIFPFYRESLDTTIYLQAFSTTTRRGVP